MKCENGACHCKIGQHFDQTELICSENTLINTSCTSNRTCNRLLGLSCQDYKCQCDSLKKYWSYEEVECVKAGGNWDKCEKDYQCKKPYVCLDKISRCFTENFLSNLFKSVSACLKINNFLISVFLIYLML
jgi:hypothetical protein